jgi:hypothetical protein
MLGQRHAPSAHTFRVAYLSTAHLTQEAAQQLQGCGNAGVPALRVMRDEYGFFVSVPSELFAAFYKQYPASLTRCVEWAFQQGFDYVLFDRDADPVSTLTTYDW